MVFFLLSRPSPIASSQCRLQILPAYLLEAYPAPAAEEQLNLEDLTPRRERAILVKNEFYDPQLESPLQRMTHLLAVPICSPCRTCVQWSWSKGNMRSKFYELFSPVLGSSKFKELYFQIHTIQIIESARLHHFASRAPNTTANPFTTWIGQTTLPVDYSTSYSRHFWVNSNSKPGIILIKPRCRCVYWYSILCIAYKIHPTNFISAP